MRLTVCRLEDLRGDRGRLVEVLGEEVVLFRVGEEIYAVENTCPHRGGPLAFGEQKGSTVFCPLHAWAFDVRTGRCAEFPEAQLKTYRVVVEGGEVQVEL